MMGTTSCIPSCLGRCRQRRRDGACEWARKECGALQWNSSPVSSARWQDWNKDMYEDKTLITSVWGGAGGGMRPHFEIKVSSYEKNSGDNLHGREGTKQEEKDE